MAKKKLSAKNTSSVSDIPEIKSDQPLKIEEELKPHLTTIEVDKKDKNLFYLGAFFVVLIFLLNFLVLIFYFKIR